MEEGGEDIFGKQEDYSYKKKKKMGTDNITDFFIVRRGFHLVGVEVGEDVYGRKSERLYIYI